MNADTKRVLRRGLPVWVLGASLSCTLAIFLALRGLAREHDELHFREHVRAAQHGVEERLDRFDALLSAAAAFVELDPDVDAAEFQEYFATQQIRERHPDVTSAGLVRSVPRERRADVDEELAAAHGPGVRVHPPGDTPFIHAYVCLEPPGPAGDPRLGYDASTEPARRKAIERALATGRAALTEPVRLVDGPDSRDDGFVMYRRVVRRTPGAPGGGVVGLVGIGFRGREFLEEAAAATHEQDVALALAASSGVVARTAQAPAGATRRAEARIDAAGTTWTLSVTSLPAFEAQSLMGRAWLAAAAGALVSLGLYLVLHRERRAFERAERDAEEIRAARDALVAGERLLREATDNLSEVVWLHDLESERQLYISPSFERVWGIPRSRIDEDPDVWMQSIHPDDRGRIAEAVERQVSHGYDVQYRIVRPDGTVRWIRDRATVLRDREGAARRLVGTATDITDLHDAQEAVLAKEQQYLHAQKMEAVGRLAAGISHDFRNLLTVMRGYGEMIAASGDPRSRAHAAEIVKAAERSDAITRQLLAFSRRSERRPEPLDLREVVNDAAKLLGRLLGADVELVRDLAPSLPRVVADRTQLEQVLVNLAVNARDAMPRGGRLTLRTEALVLTDSAARAEGLPAGGFWVVLTVSDTGVGMTPEVAARAFEPFFTTKEPGRGTGLGLSTVHGIVAQSGGRVRLESAPGAGTRFRIHLPAAAADEPTTPAPRQDPLPPGGTETILLVEDDEHVRAFAAEVLADAGYRVLAAEHPAAALRLVLTEGGHPDVLLADVVLPHAYGTELAQRVRELRPEVAVVLCSGYPAEARPAGHVSDAVFLRKPYTRAALLAAVRRALEAAPVAT